MDWQNEEDLIAFLHAVKEHRAHLSQRGWAEGKWERVRNDLASAFPQRTMNSVSALNSHFHHTLLKRTGPYSKVLSGMPKVEQALHELIQDRESRIAHAQTALQDREAMITNTTKTVLSRGDTGPLFTCSNDSINVAALQMLRIVRVHELEVGITLAAKWELAHRMLTRFVPPGVLLSTAKSIRELVFPSFMKAVAAKYGTSGPPVDQAGMLESEKLACQMLAEGNVSSLYTHSAHTAIAHQEIEAVKTIDTEHAVISAATGDGQEPSSAGGSHENSNCRSAEELDRCWTEQSEINSRSPRTCTAPFITCGQHYSFK